MQQKRVTGAKECTWTSFGSLSPPKCHIFRQKSAKINFGMSLLHKIIGASQRQRPSDGHARHGRPNPRNASRSHDASEKHHTDWRPTPITPHTGSLTVATTTTHNPEHGVQLATHRKRNDPSVRHGRSRPQRITPRGATRPNASRTTTGHHQHRSGGPQNATHPLGGHPETTPRRTTRPPLPRGSPPKHTTALPARSTPSRPHRVTQVGHANSATKRQPHHQQHTRVARNHTERPNARHQHRPNPTNPNTRPPPH